MPAIKVICSKCKHNYTAFVLADKGFSLLNYPCPRCNNLSKEILPGQDDKLEKYKVEVKKLEEKKENENRDTFKLR